MSSRHPNYQVFLKSPTVRLLCHQCGGRPKVRGYDFCSPCKRVERSRVLAPYRAELATNAKKTKECEQDVAYLKEAAKNVKNSKDQVRQSEKRLNDVKKTAEKELSEEFKPTPVVDGDEPSSDEFSSDGEDNGSDLEDFVVDDLPAPPQQVKKRKAPTKTTVTNDPDGAPAKTGAPTKTTVTNDPDGAPAKIGATPSVEDLVDLKALQALQAQKSPENHFEEVDIMSMDTETDPTETMPFSRMECTLCANLQDGTDFGTAGCSHTLHRDCFETRLPTTNACPDCRTPFGLFAPLPTPQKFRRLRQKTN